MNHSNSIRGITFWDNEEWSRREAYRSRKWTGADLAGPEILFDQWEDRISISWPIRGLLTASSSTSKCPTPPELSQQLMSATPHDNHNIHIIHILSATPPPTSPHSTLPWPLYGFLSIKTNFTPKLMASKSPNLLVQKHGSFLTLSKVPALSTTDYCMIWTTRGWLERRVYTCAVWSRLSTKYWQVFKCQVLTSSIVHC